MMELIRKYRAKAEEYEARATSAAEDEKRLRAQPVTDYYSIVANSKLVAAASADGFASRIQAALCRAVVRDLEAAFTTNA